MPSLTSQRRISDHNRRASQDATEYDVHYDELFRHEAMIPDYESTPVYAYPYSGPFYVPHVFYAYGELHPSCNLLTDDVEDDDIPHMDYELDLVRTHNRRVDPTSAGYSLTYCNTYRFQAGMPTSALLPMFNFPIMGRQEQPPCFYCPVYL